MDVKSLHAATEYERSHNYRLRSPGGEDIGWVAGGPEEQTFVGLVNGGTPHSLSSETGAREAVVGFAEKYFGESRYRHGLRQDLE